MQLALRALAILGEDQHPAVVPRAAAAWQRTGSARSSRSAQSALASGRWRLRSAISCIRSSSSSLALSRRAWRCLGRGAVDGLDRAASPRPRAPRRSAPPRSSSASGGCMSSSACLGTMLVRRWRLHAVAARSRGAPQGSARTPRSRRAAAAEDRRRAARRRLRASSRCQRSAPRAPCGTRRAGARARARVRPRADRRWMRDDLALREPALHGADVLLEPAHHHASSSALPLTLTPRVNR